MHCHRNPRNPVTPPVTVTPPKLAERIFQLRERSVITRMAQIGGRAGFMNSISGKEFKGKFDRPKVVDSDAARE